MAEVRFYALERRGLEEALAERLEEGLAEGLRIAVEANGREQVEALDERLWTLRDESFLPHGVAGAADASRQPVLIGETPENGNAAAWRVFVGGADPIPCLSNPDENYRRLVVLFDDRLDAAKGEARKAWAAAKAAGHDMSFWREGDDGGWRRSG